MHSINSIPADYIYITDINNFPCVLLKKQKELRIYNGRIDQEKIMIVKREIESWYKAGFGDNKCNEFQIPIHTNTDDLTKEEFDQLIPKKFDRLTFMLRILECYSIDTAVNKNRSFKYFLEKYNC